MKVIISENKAKFDEYNFDCMPLHVYLDIMQFVLTTKPCIMLLLDEELAM